MSREPRWRPGDRIISRQVLHGRVWAAFPEYVVEDTGDTVVTFIQTGSEMGFREHPHEVHPWQRLGYTHWFGHGSLSITPADDPWSVCVFWEGDERRFEGWYLNLQDPMRAHGAGLDTLDHELDYLVDLDGLIEEKDGELFEQRIQTGRYSPEMGDWIRANAARLRETVSREGVPCDPRWAVWEPPADWGPLTLPPGWEDIPPTVGEWQ